DKCVLIDKHDMCVLKSVAKPLKETVAFESNKKPRNFTRKIYEHLLEIVLFIVDSGCSKHMTGNLKLLINFMEKFLGTVKFRNEHNCTYSWIWRSDLEVAFRKSTCFIRDLKGNDLLSGSRETDLYSITLQDTNYPNPICLVAKATSSQAWLVQRGLQAEVGVVRTDKGMEFLNQTLHAYFAAEGIQHQTSVA
nr:hypothetical protein [Tanacetum cinerariifolium]